MQDRRAVIAHGHEGLGHDIVCECNAAVGERRVEIHGGREWLIENVVFNQGVCGLNPEDNLSLPPRIGKGKRIIEDREVIGHLTVAVVHLHAPSPFNVVKNVVLDGHIACHARGVGPGADVYSVVVVLIINIRAAAVFSWRESPDVMDEVLLHSDVRAA